MLIENRHGLAVDGSLTPATDLRSAAGLAMATQLPPRATLGADKSYYTRDFVDGLRGLAVTTSVAQNTTHQANAIDGRTTRHVGYLVTSGNATASKRSSVGSAQDPPPRSGARDVYPSLWPSTASSGCETSRSRRHEPWPVLDHPRRHTESGGL